MGERQILYDSYSCAEYKKQINKNQKKINLKKNWSMVDLQYYMLQVYNTVIHIFKGYIPFRVIIKTPMIL